jgi:signal transduction histidine kinase
MALATVWCRLPDSTLAATQQAHAEYDAQDELISATPSMHALFGAQILHVGAPLSWLAEHLKLQLLLGCDRTPEADVIESAVALDVPTRNGLRDVWVKNVFFNAPDGSRNRRVLVLDRTDSASQQARQARHNQMGRFLSHDVRAPIAAIISKLRQDARKAIADSGIDAKNPLLHQATNLLSQMDDFALAMAAERGQLQLTEALLENLLEEAIGSALPQLKNKNQTIRQSAGPGTVFVRVDGQLMVRALGYLLTNAGENAPLNSAVLLQVSDIQTAPTPAQPSSLVLIEISNMTNTIDPLPDNGFPIGPGFVKDVVRHHCGVISRVQTKDGRMTVSMRLPCSVQL